MPIRTSLRALNAVQPLRCPDNQLVSDKRWGCHAHVILSQAILPHKLKLVASFYHIADAIFIQAEDMPASRPGASRKRKAFGEALLVIEYFACHRIVAAQQPTVIKNIEPAIVIERAWVVRTGYRVLPFPGNAGAIAMLTLERGVLVAKPAPLKKSAVPTSRTSFP
jgi:hypothetical protein